MEIVKSLSSVFQLDLTNKNLKSVVTAGGAIFSALTCKTENELVRKLNQQGLSAINAGDVNRLHERYMTAHKRTLLATNAALVCDAVQRFASNEKIASIFSEATTILFPAVAINLFRETNLSNQMLEKFKSLSREA